MKLVYKTSYFVFALTLFGFAFLQLNDPDPVIWFGFYAICALVPSLLLFNKFYRTLFWLAIALCAVQLFIAAPGAHEYYLHRAEEPLMQSMNTQKPFIEECREFLGSLIALVLMIASAFLERSKYSKSASGA